MLVDAAAEPDTLLPLIGDAGLDRGRDAPTSTGTTTGRCRGRGDRHRALPSSPATPDADAVTEQTGVPVTRRVGTGDTVAVGDCTLEVIPIAGHTPGSIALLYDDPDGHPHLFTGDSLFPGGVGATFGNADAFAQLIEEVSTKLFDRLPDDTWFYPGHGDDSTLGAERPRSPSGATAAGDRGCPPREEWAKRSSAGPTVAWPSDSLTTAPTGSANRSGSWSLSTCRRSRPAHRVLRVQRRLIRRAVGPLAPSPDGRRSFEEVGRTQPEGRLLHSRPTS